MSLPEWREEPIAKHLITWLWRPRVVLCQIAGVSGFRGL